LHNELSTACDLEMALYTGLNEDLGKRWPANGWISGNISDLSILIQAASVPPEMVDIAADQLIFGISEAACLIESLKKTNPQKLHEISVRLQQEDGVQTRRMAMTILANAFIFHDVLAGGPGGLSEVLSLTELRAQRRLRQDDVISEWQKILKVNYWPIFDIACRIFEVIPKIVSLSIVETLAKTASNLIENRLMRSHDLTGAIFQRLIADRKFLAAFYTTPASAALLVGLAIQPDKFTNGGSWSNAEDIKNLRMGDFACGTGTLLSTAYHRIGQLHEIAGGDSQNLHADMMANSLVGCDILPAATHLTASMLAGAHPTIKYDKSSIYTVSYGMDPEHKLALGSLDLLSPQSSLGIISITSQAIESNGATARNVWLTLPHRTFDIVIMNPPFTRPTGHEGKKIGVPNPMFAAFGSDKELQSKMSKATDNLIKGTSAHGNAGEASIFLVLADRMIKPNGTLALVMPLSLVSGDAWEKSRLLLAKKYANLVVVSIAGTEDSDLSFSSDTGMGECLVTGCNSPAGSKRAIFVVLDKRPENTLVGESIAAQIRHLIESKNIRCLEDGPVGGTRLRFGDDKIGQVLNAPLPVSGGWYLARIADMYLAQTAYQLVRENRIWLPGMNKSDIKAIPITTVKSIGTVGPYHADINGRTSSGGIRGPFDVELIKPGAAPTYPVLWAHNAPRQRTMMFVADHEGLPRQGTNRLENSMIDQKIEKVWGSASHCHFNRDFRFNSQSTGMQFTKIRTIGGCAWPSIQLPSVEQEKALVVWSNTTLGLLSRWWVSNKQQSGRGRMGVNSLRTMPVLDITALARIKLKAAVKIFDEMSMSTLFPVNEIDHDLVRAELDKRFGREVLGLPESVLTPGGSMALLRKKLAREPSIYGSKVNDNSHDDLELGLRPDDDEVDSEDE
jgi:hypothetical protein